MENKLAGHPAGETIAWQTFDKKLIFPRSVLNLAFQC